MQMKIERDEREVHDECSQLVRTELRPLSAGSDKTSNDGHWAQSGRSRSSFMLSGGGRQVPRPKHEDVIVLTRADRLKVRHD